MIKFHPSVFNGCIKAPASEASAQRLLFASAMGSTRTLIHNMPECGSIDASMECLRSFGCSFSIDEYNQGALVVDPFVKTNPIPSASFNFYGSSVTSRFTVPLAAAIGMRADCLAYESLLKKRQMFPITSRMAIRGVSFTNFSLPFSMQGRLAGGEFKFSADDDPQCISALMMALPVLRGDSDIILDVPLQDSSSVDMTIAVLSGFGIRVDRTENGYHVPGGQVYVSPPRLTVDNDWALANVWVTTGVFSARKGGRVEIEDLSEDSTQLYRNMSPAYALLSQDFCELNLDCSQFPEMATVFAAAAAFKGATLHLTGFPQLKFGDSNRFESVKQLVESVGGTCKLTDGGIEVFGNPDFDYENKVLDFCDDPWMFISIAAAAPLLRYPVVIEDEHGADRIYRNFLNDYKTLGGKFEIE